jgi:hypothetical protein
VDTKCCTQSASDPTPSNGARYSAPPTVPDVGSLGDQLVARDLGFVGRL